MLIKKFFILILVLGIFNLSEAQVEEKQKNINSKSEQRNKSVPMPVPPSSPKNTNVPKADIVVDGKLFKQESTGSSIKNVNGKYYFSIQIAGDNKELLINVPYDKLMGKRSAFIDSKASSKGDSMSVTWVEDKTKNIIWLMKTGTMYISEYNEGTQRYSGLFNGNFAKRDNGNKQDSKNVFIKGTFVNVPFSLP